MKSFDQLPKTVKKTVRYILQNGDVHNLEEIEEIITSSINKRKEMLQNQTKVSINKIR